MHYIIEKTAQVCCFLNLKINGPFNICVNMCVSVCVYLRWMSSHHPFLSRLPLVVYNGSLAETFQGGEHGLLHLTKPVFHIALCSNNFSKSHLTLHKERQDQLQLKTLFYMSLLRLQYSQFSQPLLAIWDQRTDYRGYNQDAVLITYKPFVKYDEMVNKPSVQVQLTLLS